MKKKSTPTAAAHAGDRDPQDDLHHHFQISLEQIRAGKGISAEESLRQLDEDLADEELNLGPDQDKTHWPNG